MADSAESGFFVTVSGEVAGAQMTGTDDLYVKYSFNYGVDWTVMHGLEHGISQVARQTAGRAGQTFAWNYPVDISFKSTNVFGWPQIVLTVYSISLTGKDIVKGYGSVHIPTTPGRHVRYVRLYTPVSSSLCQRFTAWITGNPPEYFNSKFIAQGKGREVTRTASHGTAKIVLNVSTRNMAEWGYETSGEAPAITPSASSSSSSIANIASVAPSASSSMYGGLGGVYGARPGPHAGGYMNAYGPSMAAMMMSGGVGMAGGVGMSSSMAQMQAANSLYAMGAGLGAGQPVNSGHLRSSRKFDLASTPNSSEAKAGINASSSLSASASSQYGSGYGYNALPTSMPLSQPISSASSALGAGGAGGAGTSSLSSTSTSTTAAGGSGLRGRTSIPDALSPLSASTMLPK